MNINLKLRERRDKLNKIAKHEKTKAYRRFNQAKKELEVEGNPDETLKKKIEKYEHLERMVNNFDTKLTGEDISSKPNQENKKEFKHPRTEKKEAHVKDNKEPNKFLNKKHERKTKEEIEKEKEDKKIKRQKQFRKFQKKTQRGQPLMKYRVEHLFSKIKNKKAQGLI